MLWCLYAATLLYIGQATAFCVSGNWPMATVFVAYALANIGLIAANG